MNTKQQHEGPPPELAGLPAELAGLPAQPGVYLFKDAKNNVLYVGKAKSLRPRVQSYFRAKANLDPAKQKMLPKVAHVETIITDTETEALIIEANLIRQHQPSYNVVLRDDKYYLFIKITANEEFPRVFPVRRLKKDGARYFGPYSSAQSVRATLRLLRRLFPYCGEKESPRDKIFPHPLFAHSAKSAPRSPACQAGRLGEVGPIYQQNITNVIRFLKGQRQEIIDTLKAGMLAASKSKQFERAAVFRDQLSAVERLDDSQKVYFPNKESFDALSLASSRNQSAVNVFSVRQGKLVGKNTFLLKHRSHTSPADILRQFIIQYYNVAQDMTRKIFIPFSLLCQVPHIFVPQRGKKRQLIKMGELSAKQLLHQETTKFASASNTKRAIQELAPALRQTNNPLRRIEAYDASTIHGQHTTGAMAVFVNGQPQKSQYRKFQLRQTNNKPDDCAALQQILVRRFSDRHKNWPLPHLILVDGGRGQLSAAQKALAELKLKIPVAALAKREEEIFIPASQKPIRLPYDSPALFLLQRLRDEAHRFTINYHKLLRSQQQKKSILDAIPGLGPKTKKKLLNHFGSLKTIRQATDKELIKIIGSPKTKIIRDYL